MPIARSGILWRRVFVVLLLAVCGLYFWYARSEFPHGGSRFGLAYGVAGFLLILLLAFFGIRIAGIAPGSGRSSSGCSRTSISGFW